MAEGKGVGSFLRGLVFEDDPGKTPGPVSSPVVSAPVSSSADFLFVTTESKEIEKGLTQAMLASPSEFTRFFEVMEALRDIPDESMRMKSTLAVLAKDKITPDSILRAIDGHINALEGERSKFEQAAGSEAAVLDQEEAEAKRVAEQIAGLQKRQAELTTSAATRAGKIETAKRMFEAAFTAVRRNLDAVKPKINANR